MEQFLKQLAYEAPGIAALVIVVFIVFRYLSKRDREHLKQWREMHAENMEARQHSREVIEKCMTVMSLVCEVIHGCGKRGDP